MAYVLLAAAVACCIPAFFAGSGRLKALILGAADIPVVFMLALSGAPKEPIIVFAALAVVLNAAVCFVPQRSDTAMSGRDIAVIVLSTVFIVAAACFAPFVSHPAAVAQSPVYDVKIMFFLFAGLLVSGYFVISRERGEK